MSYEWQMDFRPRTHTAAALLPPATVDESAWDILLALHPDDHRTPSLEALGRRVSVSRSVLNRWLSLLEQRHLVTGVIDDATDELRAVLTPGGRQLLDRYLSATNDLQVRADHHFN